MNMNIIDPMHSDKETLWMKATLKVKVDDNIKDDELKKAIEYLKKDENYGIEGLDGKESDGVVMETIADILRASKPDPQTLEQINNYAFADWDDDETMNFYFSDYLLSNTPDLIIEALAGAKLIERGDIWVVCENLIADSPEVPPFYVLHLKYSEDEGKVRMLEYDLEKMEPAEY